VYLSFAQTTQTISRQVMMLITVMAMNFMILVTKTTVILQRREVVIMMMLPKCYLTKIVHLKTVQHLLIMVGNCNSPYML
jgi:hypothetical protein